jgi:hypothetical protein
MYIVTHSCFTAENTQLIVLFYRFYVVVNLFGKCELSFWLHYLDVPRVLLVLQSEQAVVID